MRKGEKGRDKEKTSEENRAKFGIGKPRMGMYSIVASIFAGGNNLCVW